MSDAYDLLERIENALNEHGGDLGGWTKLDDEQLQIFDGRVTLRSDIYETEDGGDQMVHAHVSVRLHEHDDEELDACLFGMGDDREEALSQAAAIWLTSVAGPIRSFLDNKPVCMTSQAGVIDGDAEEGYSPGDYGLPGLRAFVGPSIARGIEDESVQAALDDTKPWFRWAAESAAPRRVHLAKVTMLCKGEEGWHRELEIDGHEVSHVDPDWPAGIQGPDFGYMTRFAVFEFPRNSTEIARRAELERTIHRWIELYPVYDDIDKLMADMVQEGFDADLVHEVESISTIAFGRMFFEPHGVQYSPWVIRARRDGAVESEVPLMSIPAYSRARAIGATLPEKLSEDELQSLCLYNAESHAILQALEAAGDEKVDLEGLNLFPCVVPERGVSEQTMNQAMEQLQALIEASQPKKKPWWKFW